MNNDAYYNLADGYVCARILNHISPSNFSDQWLAGIKPVPPNGSWRLRVSNLKRILQKIYDYASDLQSPQFSPDAVSPDVTVIAQNFDPFQINRLIQLILFCAINCENKEFYIEEIRLLPTQIKQDIKSAIEELLVKPYDNQLLNSSGNDNKDSKAQACHELEMKVRQLQTERDRLAYENEQLLAIRNERVQPTERRQSNSSAKISQELDRANSNIDRSPTSDDLLVKQNQRLQNEMQRLKEELIKIETEKEEFRLKSTLLKEDLDKITMRHEDLRDKAEQARRLQDELDEHKHISSKVTNYEQMIQNLVKKNNDLKEELKSLKEKNVVHVQNIAKLEQENHQLSTTSSQVGIYKKQLNDTQLKLSEETHRADKAEVELTRLVEKLEITRRENERLYEATSRLMSDNSAAKDGLKQSETIGQEFVIQQESSSDNVLSLIKRVEDLQRSLFQRDQELRDVEAKYKKNIQKAKEVMKALNSNSSQIAGGSGPLPGAAALGLHPSFMSSTSSFTSNSLDETNLLRQQLRDREERLIELEREFYEFKKMKEVHERLILSAFYGLTTPMQWKNAEKRLERTTLTTSPPNTANSSLNNHFSLSNKHGQ